MATALMTGCAGGGSRTSAPVSVQREFPQIQIPSMYGDDQRLSYASEHYWDRFLSTDNFYPCDENTLNGVSIETVEGNFATYVALLESSELEPACQAVKKFFSKLEAYQQADTASTVFGRMSEMMEKYLYDPNSPYRNEDIYAAYVECLAASPLTDPDLVPAYVYTSLMCSLNRIGTPAADFRYVDAAGRSHTLYGNKAEYTLLFFSNPGCEACMEIIQTLMGMEQVNALLASKRLAVVNVYIDDEIDKWKAYQSHYPSTWSNGYDPTYSIRENISYNVRAIPSLYLLDADKKVIMKDAPQENVFRFLYDLL